jgi:hypothetical protein
MKFTRSLLNFPKTPFFAAGIVALGMTAQSFAQAPAGRPPAAAQPATQRAAPAATQEVQQQAADDGVEFFPALKAEVDKRAAEWQKLEKEVVEGSIPQLLKRNPCNPRVKPELQRVRDAMKKYQEAEISYYKNWAEAAREQLKSVSSLDANEQNMVKAIDEKQTMEQNDLDEAQKQLDALNKQGKDADAVKAEAEDLIQRINANRAVLAETMAEATKSKTAISNTQTLLSIRESKIKQVLAGIDDIHLKFDQYYQTREASYAALCKPVEPTLTGPTISFPKSPASPGR